MSGKPLSAMIEPGTEDSETLTPEQLQALRKAAEAQRAALAQQQQHGGHAHDHDHHHGHNHPHPPQGQQMQMQQPGAPTPQGLAVAQWLRNQNLKTRQCILNHERRDLFKVKRAIRALQSPEYAKASAKKPQLLPPCPDRASAENVFKLLPLGMLALRVSKVDPKVAHEGHGHAPPKRVKGLWNVQIEPQQEVRDELHFVWLYDGPQIMQKVYAGGALVAIMAIVMFPLWPVKMRLGVWYLSMGMLGLIGLFFAMSIFRLILFVVTMFAAPPGLWLYPNLFEDVGFFDSFRPVWAWHEVKKKKTKKSGDGANGAAASTKSKKKSASKTAATPSSTAAPAAAPTPAATAGKANPGAPAATSGATPTPSAVSKPVPRQAFQAMVEEGDDSD